MDDAVTFHPSTGVPGVVGTPFSQPSGGNRLFAVLAVSITLPPLQIFADVDDSTGANGTVPTTAVVVCTQPSVAVYDIVEVPADTSVNIPEPAPILATPDEVLNHVPPEGVPVRVELVVPVTHNSGEPEIDGVPLTETV